MYKEGPCRIGVELSAFTKCVWFELAIAHIAAPPMCLITNKVRASVWFDMNNKTRDNASSRHVRITKVSPHGKMVPATTLNSNSKLLARNVSIQ